MVISEVTGLRPCNFSSWHRTLDDRCATTDIDHIFCESSINMKNPVVFEIKQTSLPITTQSLNDKIRESSSQITRIKKAIKEETGFMFLLHNSDLSVNIIRDFRTGQTHTLNNSGLREFFENNIHNLGIGRFI